METITEELDELIEILLDEMGNIKFMHKKLIDLADQIHSLGIGLNELHTNLEDILQKIEKKEKEK